jgi:DNA-directed RNA polymerase specialized sigma24 family protein
VEDHSSTQLVAADQYEGILSTENPPAHVAPSCSYASRLSNGDADENPLCERLADHRLVRVQRQLSPTLRRAFQLRDVDGLSIREAANILGVPTGTVKAQSARARKKVPELLRRSRVLAGFAVTGKLQENAAVSR